MPTTLNDIAADIRKHSPGALPESLRWDFVRVGNSTWSTVFSTDDGVLGNDIAESVLIAAMVMGGQIICSDGWWFAVNPEFGDCMFEYSAHGGSLQACHAAWRFARGIA